MTNNAHFDSTALALAAAKSRAPVGEDVVERVARAMYAVCHDTPGIVKWENREEGTRERVRAEARAAIAAMPPPPEQMQRDRAIDRLARVLGINHLTTHNPDILDCITDDGEDVFVDGPGGIPVDDFITQFLNRQSMTPPEREALRIAREALSKVFDLDGHQVVYGALTRIRAILGETDNG